MAGGSGLQRPRKTRAAFVPSDNVPLTACVPPAPVATIWTPCSVSMVPKCPPGGRRSPPLPRRDLALPWVPEHPLVDEVRPGGGGMVSRDAGQRRVRSPGGTRIAASRPLCCTGAGPGQKRPEHQLEPRTHPEPATKRRERHPAPACADFPLLPGRAGGAPQTLPAAGSGPRQKPEEFGSAVEKQGGPLLEHLLVGLHPAQEAVEVGVLSERLCV